MPTGTVNFYKPTTDEGKSGHGFIIDDEEPDARDRSRHVFFSSRFVQGTVDPKRGDRVEFETNRHPRWTGKPEAIRVVIISG